jgi:hypothetical protein
MIYTDNGVDTSDRTLIIFGWTGATYSQIFEKQKLLQKLPFKYFITIETPILQTIFCNDFNVNDIKITTKEVYILYYSGGGSLYHPEVHKMLNVDGYIFDSAPVPFGTLVFMNWLAKMHSILALLFFIPITIYMYTIGYHKLNYYNSYIRNKKFGKNSLFITSKVDPLVPLEHINNIVENQNDDNQNCYLKLFEDSDHISHDVKYPEEYIEAISDFIAR